MTSIFFLLEYIGVSSIKEGELRCSLQALRAVITNYSTRVSPLSTYHSWCKAKTPKMLQMKGVLIFESGKTERRPMKMHEESKCKFLEVTNKVLLPSHIK
ncbi:hypothetical protein BRADI_3g34713v3 [Brachypodium distachyon]|uniref:Uncharacterized protein n=1 Tax=Brachypodium distachyon TaxID=15368 RepID=A0A2K2D145_BRADI|nr:hypothetical protein BRADI_3g34713v3 [Brachypodium distachyon]